MHGLSARLFAGGNDLINDQIRVSSRRWSDMDGLISHFDMQGITVRIGIDSDCGNTHAPSGLDHAAGNFPTIGNQDFLKHKAQPQHR